MRDQERIAPSGNVGGADLGPLPYASSDVHVQVQWTRAHTVMCAAAFMLLLLSMVVVVVGANDEPYYGTIRYADAVVQVGLGTAVISLWCVWVLVLIVGAARKAAHPIILAALILPAFSIFYLANTVDGYISDIIAFQSMGGGAPTTAPGAQAVR